MKMILKVKCFMLLALVYSWEGMDTAKRFVREPAYEWSFMPTYKPTEDRDIYYEKAFPATQRGVGKKPTLGWKIDEDFSDCLYKVLKKENLNKKILQFSYTIPLYGCELDYELQHDLHKVMKAKNPKVYKRLMEYKWKDDINLNMYHNTMELALQESKVMNRIKAELNKNGFVNVWYHFEKIRLIKPYNLFQLTIWIVANR